jgi:hypothetical protein
MGLHAFGSVGEPGQPRGGGQVGHRGALAHHPAQGTNIDDPSGPPVLGSIEGREASRSTIDENHHEAASLRLGYRRGGGPTVTNSTRRVAIEASGGLTIRRALLQRGGLRSITSPPARVLTRTLPRRLGLDIGLHLTGALQLRFVRGPDPKRTWASRWGGDQALITFQRSTPSRSALRSPPVKLCRCLCAPAHARARPAVGLPPAPPALVRRRDNDRTTAAVPHAKSRPLSKPGTHVGDREVETGPWSRAGEVDPPSRTRSRE